MKGNSEIELVMKSNKSRYRFLPSWLVYHLKIVAGSLVATLFFSLLWRGRLITPDFWFMFLIVVIQIEIFIPISFRIFSKKSIRADESYKKVIIRKLLNFFTLTLIISLAILFLTIAGIMVIRETSFQEILGHFIKYELLGFAMSWLIGVAIGSLFFFYIEWTNALRRENKLREEKLIFQYETLKNQVNPHFLFNSLNTLSSLVSTDARLSETFINKLSSIYRYILENKDVDLINLNRELMFVEDYFYLQKIRDNGKINLTVDISNPDHFEVIPISIQMLVENALKHNAATREQPLEIHIFEESENIVVENEIRPKMQLEPSQKIGLKNLMERTKLAMNRSLEIFQNDGRFTVKIPVKKIQKPH